jgi:diguanylate cyclase (GGDEF)-like protein
MDVNYLKKVNDTYGHMVGDDYLIHFTKVLQDNLKENEILSRTGGDEFVIIFPELDLHQSLDRIENIRSSFNKHPFIYQDFNHIVDFGCGVACYPKDHYDLTGLMRIADKRMYDNKRERKLSN